MMLSRSFRFVVVQLTHHEHHVNMSQKKQAPSQIRKVALQRTIQKRVELVESYLASSFCILLHTTSIKFLACRIHRLFCVLPNQVQRLHARISSLLHWKNLVETFRMYPVNLFTSRSQHKIFGQRPTVDIIPESSSFLQDLIILEKDFWYWTCNLLNCIQLVILFELFSSQSILEDTCSTTLSASQESHNFSPKIPVHVLQSGSPRLF